MAVKPKGISADSVFLIIIIATCVIFLFMAIPGFLEKRGWNLCVQEQMNEIRKIEEIGKSAEIGIEKATSFDVKWCTKCIWYEENATHKWLNVWFKEEASPTKRFVENKYLNIGNSKNNAKLNRDDFEYSFWVRKGEVDCTNCDEIETLGC